MITSSQTVTKDNISELLPVLWERVCNFFDNHDKPAPNIYFWPARWMAILKNDIISNVPGSGIAINREETIYVGMLVHELAHVFTDNEDLAKSAETQLLNM